MIPILQAISQVAVPVVADPINVGGNGDGLSGVAILSIIIAAGVIAFCFFVLWSKVSALAMWREFDRERRQDDAIRSNEDRRKEDRQNDRMGRLEATDHAQEHSLLGQTFPSQRTV